MRTATKREQEKAKEIMDWIPRPLYINNGAEKGTAGPGIDKLRELGPIGYTALRSIILGASVKESTLISLEISHKSMRNLQKQSIQPQVQSEDCFWAVWVPGLGVETFEWQDDAMERAHRTEGVYFKIPKKHHNPLGGQTVLAQIIVGISQQCAYTDNRLAQIEAKLAELLKVWS